MLKPRLLIVGGSYAALNAATAARDSGFDGTVTMVSAEAHAPYQRPPLSKALLKGAMHERDLPLKGEAFYRDQAIDLILDRRAEALDLHDRRIRLSDASSLAFDVLVLATGARPRRLPSAESEGVHYLRDLPDALSLRARLAQAGSVIILGGGYIGLEVASAAAAMGLEVRLVAGNRRILARYMPAAISERFSARHLAAGVEIVAGTAIRAGAGHVTLTDGRTLKADLVVAGIGALPNGELASEAGLSAAGGIEVDEFGRTAAPKVYAVGDCTSHHNLWSGRRLRLESVQNAIDQGRATGHTLAGRPTPYLAAPRFWSDQYDLKLQMVGFSEGADRDVVLSSSETTCSMMHVKDERIIGVTSINDVRTQMWARRSLAGGPVPLASVTPPTSAPQPAGSAA